MMPARQRGFYSEVLDAELEPTSQADLKQVAQQGSRGTRLQPRLAAPRQRVPRAAMFESNSEEAQAAAAERAAELQAATDGSAHARTADGQVAPPRALEPKVLVPHQPGPGRAPRKIVIERQKRLFALQDVHQLILDLGVDTAEPERPGAMSLELFDDTEYESRSLEEWLQLGGIADGGGGFLPAKCLLHDADNGNRGRWVDCRVLAHEAESHAFRVVHTQDGPGSAEQEAMVLRINLCFSADDPFVFAKRVAAAHAAREHAVDRMRFNLFVDAMPTEELPPLEKERVNRMLALALNTERLKERHLNASSLLNEVNMEYGRTMSSIIFQGLAESAEEDNQHSIFRTFTMPAPEEKRPVPWSGVVEVPPHECLEQKQGFGFHTLLSKREIIGCLVKVRTECNKALTLQLYNTNFTKSIGVEEFEQTQAATLLTTIEYLKLTWSAALKNGVKASLKEVGKGWYNLNEKVSEVYAISKLKRLLRTVNFIMEDSVTFMAEDSLNAYATFVCNRAAFDVAIISPAEVTVVPRGIDAADLLRSTPPLFSLELFVQEPDEEGGGAACAAYRIAPQAYTDMVLSVFDKGANSVQDIAQLEKFVMEDLFWSHTPMLQTVSAHEGLTPALRGRIKAALEQALPCTQAYLEQYAAYDAMFALDVDAYLAEFSSEEKTVAQITAEVTKHQERVTAIEAEVPLQMSLGLFWVSTAAVRKFLVEKHQEIAQLVLKLLATQIKEQSKEIMIEFEKINRQLAKKPDSIEAVADLEEYAAQLPATLDELQGQLKKMQADLGTLDEFEFSLPDEEFKALYSVLASPKKIDVAIEHVGTLGEELRDRYQNEMMSEQEAFQKQLDKLERVINGFGKYTDLGKVKDVANEVTKMQGEIKAAELLRGQFNSREALFGNDVTDYSQLAAMAKTFEPYATLWLTAGNWTKNRSEWNDGQFASLDPEMMEKELANAQRNMYKLSKTFADTAGLGEIAMQIKNEVEAFMPVMPLVTALRNPGMRERHWTEMSKATGKDLTMAESDEFTLVKMKEMNLDEAMEAVTKISDVAGKEYAIEQAMDKMEGEWENVSLDITAYRESGTFVLKGFDEVQVLLDDHIVMTQAMSFSPFKGPFAQRIEDWEKMLTLMSDVFEEWLKCQRQWMYLEPIFSSDDIMRQLPTEGKRFNGVDRTWRKLLQQAFNEPHCLTFCKTARLLPQFTEGNQMLEMVQKGLTEYLETKRGAFARFYFLSNDELLEILSQTKDPLAVQQHLSKCFENIAKLEFQPDLQMTAMISGEGETVKFTKGLYPKGGVEYWMTDVLNEMKNTTRQCIIDACADYRITERGEWVLKWPGATLIAVCTVFWSLEVEEYLNAKGNQGMHEYYDKAHEQLMQLTLIVSGSGVTKLQRKSLGALITIEVHARDVVANMRDQGVDSVNEFMWASQLRYELAGDGTHDGYKLGDTLVKQLDATFLYGYEYLGNSMRLVITPLTDRIYLTLTGALQLYLGGAPAGPAGTGKTETTKDLAKALAKQCVVFNCQEGLDYVAMGKFFRGLAMSGAWACFDEFNRIDLEVLSVVAQQVSSIQLAMAAKLLRFEFEGNDIPLDSENAVFITMNPGYAGRSELPDNLKCLFRPVACMVPDYALIAEIRLYSFGYKDARRLSQKMVATFRFASEQVSGQDHYDFGMRAVNTVIQAAGNNRAAFPDMKEDLLVLSALADSNRPKFLADDMKLFNGILSDLFPGWEVPVPDYEDLLGAIKVHCAKNCLVPTEAFLFRCIQIYEVSVLRHGFMTVGPTGGAKTSAKDMLLDGMADLDGINPKYSKTKQWTINPKAITMGQLYGAFDENTHEWTDGILCVLYRSAVKEFSEFGRTDRQWLVFDGPVDALWIESMNTVLDDNRKLCLVSGEIITMSPYMSMVFEVEDLSVASPATVSRVGSIYMEPDVIVGIMPQVEAYLMSITAEKGYKEIEPHKEKVLKLLEQLLPGCIEYTRKHTKEYLVTVDNNLAKSTLNMLHQFWTQFIPIDGAYEVPEELTAVLPKLIEKFVVFSVLWGAGASTDGASRPKFDAFLKGKLAEFELTETVGIPEEGMMYDYAIRLDHNEEKPDFSGKWVGWMETVPAFELSPKTEFADIIVPTVDSVRYMWITDTLAQHKMHTMAVGPTGTGKTLNVNNKLMAGMPDKFQPIFIGFSAQTSANQTQDLLDAKMDKRRKGIYGPSPGKQYIIFVDDVNMPQREEYGAQPPIEILRMWMNHGFWYDRKLSEKRQIVDISFVGALGPPGGGRQIVTNRFLRYFNFVSFPELDDGAMKQIFNVVLQTFVKAYLPPDLLDVVYPMVDATIELYNVIGKELLPTPSKPHYTFNLRDVASVIQGVLSGDRTALLAPEDIIRLWSHENLRVYRDRLVNDDDRSWFDDLIKRLVPKFFSIEWADVVKVEVAHLIYGDFMVPGADPKIYSEITDTVKMVTVVEESLEDYNATNTKKMPLVMFVDAVSHVARISRIIRQPLGNALLLGVGGSGRQSLARLATAMAEFDCFQIEIAKNYGKVEWRDDLRKALLIAGDEGKSLTFLFTDTQIVKESFLEDINNILNTGEVPNLFDDNEVNSITSNMRPIAQAAGLPATKVALYSLFVKRVRKNVHMALCMSPLSSEFAARLRNFPSLVNNCTIDFFAPWPEEALRNVAFTQLETTDLGSDEIKNGIVTTCGVIHQSVEVQSGRYLANERRYNYVTPTSYLELLSTFKTLLKFKRDQVLTAKRRLVLGLEKLATTEVEVDALKKHLEEMQPVLIKTSADVTKMMEEIEVDKASADETRAVVMKEEEIASTKAEQCQQIKDSAEKDLAEALPALDAAVAVLRNLKLSDISEVAKYANPPGGVKLVMEAMCVLKGVPPKMVGAAGQKTADYWEPGKKMLQDAKGLLDSMFNFDKDNIPEKIIDKLKQYIDSEDFQPKKIEAVSKSCTAMCQWVRAMDKYHHVAKEVEPKRKALKESQEELDVLTQKLNKLRSELKVVEDKIADLEAKFAEAVAKKEELAAKVEDATVKMDRAGRLLGGLGGEKTRWIATVESLTIEEANLIGDVCVAAGAVAYLGPFIAGYRIACEGEWRVALSKEGVPATEGATLSNVMNDAIKLRGWQVHGLPADLVSSENGIILANSRRWPLSIDPQGQANKWIRNMEAANGVEVCKPSDKDFLRTLENAVRFGKPVIMENVLSAIDPALEPVLLKLTFKQGGAEVMKIGDNTIPYHPDFKFYMTSKLPNPHYAPEVSVKVTILNFTITQEGLEDQLLGITVAKERPDLEETKNNLIIQNAKMAGQLKDIESTILKLLSESEGNILDDEGLINTLAQSKVTSNEIAVKADEAAATEVIIDKTRNEYRPVAFRGALLFFCVADMGKVDPMYQYSMPWFTNLFMKAIDDSEKSDEMAVRLTSLNDYFTYALYVNICRSLFEAHKLLFSFLVCIKVMQGDSLIDPDEWRFFLSGTSGSRLEAANPDPSWITAQIWAAVTSLAKLPAFGGFEEHFANNLTAWRTYFDGNEPHNAPVPGEWDEKLNLLQKLCVLRSVRPDKVVPGMQIFVTENIGGRFIEPPPFEIGKCFKDSTNVMPIVFVLSAGADPMEALLTFAEEMRMSKKMTAVSLGQGQGPIAEKLMSLAMERGTWIMLQNCHLCSSWMPKLEAIVEQYDPDTMHRDYRMWLTSMPSEKFPVSILQNSVKMTVEPPRGVKATLSMCYLNFTDTYLDTKTPKPEAFKKCMFAVCFFHALLQDRLKFGPLGFNIGYEFTNSDLKCCMLQLETMMGKYDHVPFLVLQNLVCHINYGGRITDDWDRRMVMCLLQGVLNEGILSDDFPLAPGEHYRSPPAGNLASYREVIANVPINPHPNVFGLHANAEIACAQNETLQLSEIMLGLQAQTSSGGGKSREDVVREAAIAMQERNIVPFDLYHVADTYPLAYGESMNTVLMQECQRYNNLIHIFNRSLNDVLKALKGLVVMSSDLESMAESLYTNQVPAMWVKQAYPSLKPLAAWIDDLQVRVQFVKGWIDDGKPATYWISGFFFPQAFLTGTLQNFARKYTLSIDTVDFDYNVLKKTPEELHGKPPEDGCYIHGLFLEGAAWDPDQHALVEARPKELYSTFPPIWLFPKVDRQLTTEGIYCCPVYKTLQRAGTLSTTGHSTNFVLPVELPSLEPCSGLFSKYVETFSGHWIKRAVALFCALNY